MPEEEIGVKPLEAATRYLEELLSEECETCKRRLQLRCELVLINPEVAAEATDVAVGYLAVWTLVRGDRIGRIALLLCFPVRASARLYDIDPITLSRMPDSAQSGGHYLRMVSL